MGDDSISGGSGNDCIVGGGGNDYITAGTGNDLIAGRGGDNTIFGGSGADTIFAGGGEDNWASEENGDNYVQAGSGNTVIFGSGGNDTLLGGSGTDTINAGGGNESIVAGSGDASINGGTGEDSIVAGSGKDTIWGSTGSTTIYGGAGTDLILGTSGTDVIYAGDGGTSQAPTSITAGSGDTTIYGGEGIDQISGGSGSDVIYAGDGGTTQMASQVVAGSGDTTVYGGNGIDHIFGGSGTDVLYAGDGGEYGNQTYVTAGTGVATLYGGAGASVLTDSQGGGDVLQAGSGDTDLYGVGEDTLIAGSGSDYLSGGSSSTYIFDSNVGVAEVANGGSEAIEFTSSVDSSDLSLSAVLDGAGAGSLTIDEGDGSIIVDGGLSGANVASVDFEGSQSMSLIQLIQQQASVGSVTAATLAGNQGNFVFDVSNADSVNGGVGQDTISAWGDNDTLSTGSGGGEIYAEGTGDLVTGGASNDTLDAAAAGTTLVGGTGNEVFQVNDSSDVVDAQASAGSNAIVSSVTYALPTNVDVLTLTGTASLSATGNDDAGNVITGNSGDDTLVAGSGSDTLISGSGVDTLVGGSGPDTFVVNNSADVVTPSANEGWQDTIDSSVSYVLASPVATLDLAGSADLSATDEYGNANITGNAGNDTLIGGSGSDTLIAGMGVDTLVAGSGNNTFVINNSADVIEVGSAHGSDAVLSSASYTLAQGLDFLRLNGGSNLEGQGNADATNVIYGNTGHDTLVAGSGSDTLVAGSGSDTLVAGSGNDLLEGGPGNSTYLFDSGFGQAEIETGSVNGTIEFGAGITPSDVRLGLTTDLDGNPALLIEDGSSAITVDGGLSGSIGSFQFADGTQLTLAGLLMAASVTPGTLIGANGNAVLDTSAGASLSGGYGANSILTTGASDTLTAGTGSQYLLGAGEDDSITGGFGDDTLVGGGASDTLVAGNGAQALYALGTGDVLVGGMGDDTLYGGAGSDTLVSGTGGTVVYGGNAGDTVVLTQNANVTFYPSSSGGVEVIQLPGQMTLADFTPYYGTDGDLILQSLTGGTTAVIKGFYNSSANGKTWMIADNTGDVQLLSTWLASNSQQPSGYQSQVEQLEQAYSASIPGVLNQVGEQWGSIAEPGSAFAQTPQNQYHFDGVSTQNITVQGGALSLGSSEDSESTYTTLQTGSTTYTVTTPVYAEVTIPGASSFVKDSSLGPVDQSNMQNSVGSNGGISVEHGTDANGDPGYWVTMLPSTQYEQTGTRTVIETVPTYTTYSQTTQSFTVYNITGDGGNDVITAPTPWPGTGAPGPFVGTVDTGNGNVSVDLGMDNFYTGGYQDEIDYSSPNPLSLGAFVDAGDGNDTILGSGGADTIAAGTGFDYIDAGLGSTIYVPLQGASTEDIDILGPYYGDGPLPHSTLVLPSGITAGDLHYRLFSGATSNGDQYGNPMMTLQITYGDSTVLMDFSDQPNEQPANLYLQNVPSDDINGIDQLQFSDGTVLSRDQMLALAGAAISAGTLDPAVAALNPTVHANSSIAGASLFAGSDSSGLNITWYQISNTGTGGGYFTLDGVEQAPGQTFYVSTEQLQKLIYVAGPAGSTDTVQVSAFDGVVWGNATSFNVGASSSATQASGANQEVIGPSTGPDTLVGGYGGDTLVGSSGQDAFEYNVGGGAETVSETAPPSAANDNILQLGSGITPASLTLSVTGDPELVLSIGSGVDSVSIEDFDLLNPLQSFPIQSFMFSGGTTLNLLQLLGDSAVTGTSGSVANTDGSTTAYEFTPSGQRIYYAENVNSAGKVTADFSLNSDGSEVTDSYTYNADGSYVDTMAATPAGAGGSTTTVYDVNSQGQVTSKDITNPGGSTDNWAYIYNSDGSSIQTEVSTPAGGGSTTTVYYVDSQDNWTRVDITNPDGSTDDSTYTDNPDGSSSKTEVVTAAGGGSTTTVTSYNSQGHLTGIDITASDGSTRDYAYNADGSYVETELIPFAGGGSTATVTDYNTQGQQTVLDVTNPDGSTDDSTYTYNADGSYSQTRVMTPSGGSSTTIVYDVNSQGQITTRDTTNPDGSTDNWTYTYNSDGSSTGEEVLTPAGGGGATTTAYDVSSQGQVTSKDITNPDGSTDNWAYTYNSDGSSMQTEVSTPAGGGSTTTVYYLNSQDNWTKVHITNPDGSTDDSTYTDNPDGSRSKTEVVTPAVGGAGTTTVFDYNTGGVLVNQNTYAPGSDGSSYSDNWSQADGSHGSYWWNASTSTYEDTWYDSNGNSWTDEYQYASGGSPGTTGYSFLETYTGSDGSQGSRQYNASTGAVTLSWDSASTGQLNGTTSDSGFIGLQNQSELTNTQADLTFFNPNASASFNAFLAGH